MMSIPKEIRSAYLHLLKKTLVRFPLESSDEYAMVETIQALAPQFREQIEHWAHLCRRGLVNETGNPKARAVGKDWPATAETMLGLYRLNNIESLLCDVLERGVGGDVIEIGVWRGGAAIWMMGILYACEDVRQSKTPCRVWVADSFQGLPKPDVTLYPDDAGDTHWNKNELAVSQAEVMQNFLKYGFNPEDGVRFIPGWFSTTLPITRFDPIGLLHIDGDMYESTFVALREVHPYVVRGGYVIVDDYYSLDAVRHAVDEYRAGRKITYHIHKVDWSACYWRVE